MGNTQAGDKQNKTGKSPAKGKNFIKNLNRKSPGKESKKHSKNKNDTKHEPLGCRDFDKTPDSDNNEIETTDNDTVECVFKTLERDGAGEAEVVPSSGLQCELTVSRCEPGARSPTHDQPLTAPLPLPDASPANDSSDSVFTDPLTPLTAAVELNQCYYSAESDSAHDDLIPRTLTPSLADAPEKLIPHSESTDMPHEDATSSLSTDDLEKEDKSVMFDDNSDKSENERVMGSIFSLARNEHAERVTHECNHDFRDNRLKACPGQTSFTLSKHRKVELPPVAHDCSLSILDNAIAEKDRRHSSVSDAPMSDSNVLRKVASLTLDKHTEAKVVRPKFVPEKLDFQIYEKFEGQMLLNWFISSIAENNNLKHLLSIVDQKNFGIQYCTDLLAAGVLRQISDKNAPNELVFKPNLMYYWAHMEAPASQPVTPGKLHMSAWPPDQGNFPIQDHVNYCNNVNKENNNEDITDISEAKFLISKLRSKLQELEYQIEKMKISAQIETLNRNIDDFASLPSNNSSRVHLIGKGVQTSDSVSDLILTKKPVIARPEHDLSIRTNVNIDKLDLSDISRTEVGVNCKENLISEVRSEDIENYCKLNKSRDCNLVQIDDVSQASCLKQENNISEANNNEKFVNPEVTVGSGSSSEGSFLSTYTDLESSSEHSTANKNARYTVIDVQPTTVLYTLDISKQLKTRECKLGVNSVASEESVDIHHRSSQMALTNTSSISKNKLCIDTEQRHPPPLPGMIPPPPPMPGTMILSLKNSETYCAENSSLIGVTPDPNVSSSSVADSYGNEMCPEIPSTVDSHEIAGVTPPAPTSLFISGSPLSQLQSGMAPPTPPMGGMEISPMKDLPSPPMPEMLPKKPLPDTMPPPPPMAGLRPPPPPPPMPGMESPAPPPPPMPDMGPPPPPMPSIGPPPPPMPGMGPAPPPMPGMGPPPPPMPGMGPPPPPMPGMGPPPPPMPGMGPPPPPMPGTGPPPPPMPGMGPPPPPMPGMGPPPPPMPGMGPPPPPMPGMGPPPPPMPGMGPPPPPMPGMGPPPPPMPGMGPPPPLMPGMGPPPPPMPGMGPPPPPIPRMITQSSISNTGAPGPPPPPPTMGPVPFPAPPIGGWNMQRATLRKAPIKPAAPMKPLYWTRILAAPSAVCHGEPVPSQVKPLWLEIEEEKLDNIDEFTDLFSRQVVKAPVKKKVEVKTKRQPIKILDSKRSQNVGILAQSLHVEFSEIENAIYNFDTSVVSLEALQQIYELRANDEELASIKEHVLSKPDVPLDKPEAFLHDLSGICNFAERISCFMFQAEFEDSVNTTMHKLDNLKHTCEFLINSEPLKKLFAIILTLGNYMNGGNGQRGQADGFGLEILSKLKDVKSKQSTVTLLHFIVRTYMRVCGGALSESCALPVPEPGDVARAAALDWQHVAEHLQYLHTHLDACKEKVKTVLETDDSGNRSTSDEASTGDGSRRLDVFRDKMTSFINAAEEKLKTETDNLEECRTKFIATVRFYQYVPKGGKVDDCEPKEFFALWTSFCSDFKDIFKKEEQLAIKEKLKEAKKLQEERKSVTQPKKEGGLKSRLQKLSNNRK